MSERIGIVGGGLLGMMLALRFRQQGHEVTILEAAPELGGLAATWQLGDIHWDKHYHVILLSDQHVGNLLAELGLKDQMRWVQTKTGFYTDGKMYSMSNSVEFLKFPPLRLIDKFRLGATIMRASKIKNWQKLEQIPVVDWLKRWSGRRTTEKIWIPLLRAKLGDSYESASAAFIWAIIARMYAARRSGLKQEQFGYVQGGYATILQRFQQHLEQLGVEILTNTPTQQVRSSQAGPEIVTNNGEHSFDRVVVTTAAPIARRLLPELTAAEQLTLDQVKYQGIVCASILLKKPLDRYYVTNITDTWVPFTAVIEMTTLVDPQEFGGKTLVYLPKYVAPNDPMFEEPEEQIKERFLAALARMYPHFQREDVLAFQLSRVRNVFAISTLNYSQHVPPVTTSVPGVYLLNSSHIVNGTLNVNETLQLAETGWKTVLNSHQNQLQGVGA
ncbi:MAG: NAD(P)/FAD-dependent oxidoreductase [Zavarzinella sp.]